MKEIFTFTKKEIIIYISIILIVISTIFQLKDLFIKNSNYTVNYEYVNIKDMSKANKTTKKTDENIIKNILNAKEDLGEISAVELTETKKVEEVELVPQQESVSQQEEKQIWYLPTELGVITQYPNWSHNAYDITSSRRTQETIHPVANGTISGIYTDNAGALIVTVLHDINGTKYTSQYVHLSSYAQGIYVGMPVTINDALGQMGTTGYSTGVHLHITVLDCALFDVNDPNCNNLNSWYNYAKQRYSQGYYELGSLMEVPYTWYSR